MADNFNMKQFLAENKLGAYSKLKETQIEEVKRYQIGDMWSPDFDYKGMLKAGAALSPEADVNVMQAVSDSFEDVNYHRENTHLQDAIEAKKKGDMDAVRYHLGMFRDELAQTIKGIKETQIFEREKIEENKIEEAKKFEPGDMWSPDFDYKGMLNYAMSVNPTTDINELQALADSFEDVNYHREGELLQDAIEAIKEGDIDTAWEYIISFRREVSTTYAQIKAYEKANPDKKFEGKVEEGEAAYEYEKGKEAGEKEEEEKLAEELSPEHYDRMDGLVSGQHMMGFLSNAENIIKDLGEDGFENEDIFEYLVSKIKTLG